MVRFQVWMLIATTAMSFAGCGSGNGEHITNSVGMKLKLIPPGTFMMGSNNGDDYETGHKVTLTEAFYLGIHEVTQEQFEKVMGTNPSEFKGAQNPVSNVDWHEAVEFCRMLSELPEEKAAGRVYRLPTEAEWEYACRAGTTTEYSFGDDTSQLGDYAWYVGNSGSKAHPVGEKKPNAWGLYDMHGNVWEWCSDWWGRYPSGSVTDPVGPLDGSRRVYRGGSYEIPAWSWRPSDRSCFDPWVSFSDFGLRVALVPQRSSAGGQ